MEVNISVRSFFEKGISFITVELIPSWEIDGFKKYGFNIETSYGRTMLDKDLMEIEKGLNKCFELYEKEKESLSNEK